MACDVMGIDGAGARVVREWFDVFEAVPPTWPRLLGMARAMGVRVTFQTLPAPFCGVFDCRRSRAVLHDGLNGCQRRCTLCHELVHAAYGDTRPNPASERRTRLIAAALTVPPPVYARVSALGLDAVGAALAAGCTVQVWRDRIDAQTALYGDGGRTVPAGEGGDR